MIGSLFNKIKTAYDEKQKNKYGNRINVNGKNFYCNGSNITIKDGVVFADGVEKIELPKTPIIIHVEGDLANVTTDASVVVKGDVYGNVTSKGFAICGNVSGSVTSGGSVNFDEKGGVSYRDIYDSSTRC